MTRTAVPIVRQMQTIRTVYTLTVLGCADARHVWLITGNVHLKMFALLDVNGLKLGGNRACLLKAMMIYRNNASIA